MSTEEAKKEAVSSEVQAEQEINCLKRNVQITLELAPLQEKLRAAFKRRFDQEKEKNDKYTITELARTYNTNWSELSTFAAAERCLGKGKALTAVGDFTGRRDIADEVRRLAVSLPNDRWLGLVLLSRDALEVMKAVHERWIRVGKPLGFEGFAEIFNEKRRMILDILNLKFTPELEDASVRDQILESLTAQDFEQKTQAVMLSLQAKLQEKQNRWNSLKATLRATYPGMYKNSEEIGQLVGKHATTVRNMSRGVAGHETYDQAITALEEFLRTAPGTGARVSPTPPLAQGESPPPAETAAAVDPVAIVETGISAPTPALDAPSPEALPPMMETPVRDLRSVLTPESLIALDVEAPQEFIAFIVQRVRMARIALSALCQVRDEEILAAARGDKAFAQELIELFIALKIISTKDVPIPELIAMWSAQRDVLAAIGGNGK